MPNCKHCGARIEKFNKDMCPICGGSSPLDGVISETVEITSQFDSTLLTDTDVKIKQKKIFMLLSIILGWFGAHFFYIYKIKKGLITLLFNLLLIITLFLLMNFVFKSCITLSIIIPIILTLIINCLTSLILIKSHNFRDGNGNIVR